MHSSLQEQNNMLPEPENSDHIQEEVKFYCVNMLVWKS